MSAVPPADRGGVSPRYGSAGGPCRHSATAAAPVACCRPAPPPAIPSSGGGGAAGQRQVPSRSSPIATEAGAICSLPPPPVSQLRSREKREEMGGRGGREVMGSCRVRLSKGR